MKFMFGKKIPDAIDWSKRNHWMKSPVQLHDFVLYNSTFYDEPKLIIEKRLALRENEKLVDSTFYPFFYDSNPKTLTLIDLLVAEIRPKIVVETGVANGTSTRTILSAFMKYQLEDSRLYSFDVDARVATADLVQNPQFHFVLVGEQNFMQGMESIEYIDIFYHDSDHSYENQILEYTEAWKKIRAGGALISDDINWSNAFLDFCKQIGQPPLVLADTEKFCGVLYK